MKTTKKYLLIEASKLATDNVTIDTWEAETATEILEIYEKRKKWSDEHEEEYSMRTSFMFRVVVMYDYSKDINTWHRSIEEIKELSESEKAKA
jgi:argininosuccinate synthase